MRMPMETFDASQPASFVKNVARSLFPGLKTKMSNLPGAKNRMSSASH